MKLAPETPRKYIRGLHFVTSAGAGRAVPSLPTPTSARYEDLTKADRHCPDASYHPHPQLPTEKQRSWPTPHSRRPQPEAPHALRIAILQRAGNRLILLQERTTNVTELVSIIYPLSPTEMQDQLDRAVAQAQAQSTAGQGAGILVTRRGHHEYTVELDPSEPFGEIHEWDNTSWGQNHSQELAPPPQPLLP